MFDWIVGILTSAATGLLWPLNEFLADASSRYYWLYCATGIALAIYVSRRAEAAHPGEQPLFAPHVWLSRSARNDYFILVMGSVLRLTILSWAFLNWRVIADFVVAVLKAVGVSGQANDATALALGGLMTVTLFLVDDFVRYYAHLLMHRVPELWEFHKVHHSAEHLNFLTAERLHPLEVILSSLAGAVSFGLVNGLFIGFFGDKLTVMTVCGANGLHVLFNVAGGVLRHSPVWLSFGPRIERWIISPAMHQIHHSSDPRHFDKNLGGSLAIWDRWFGTIHIPQGREIESFGIGAETHDFRALRVLCFRPFIRSAELIKARLGAFAETWRRSGRLGSRAAAGTFERLTGPRAS
jgi:sterol desaturase/sphingolipid hydroxylase (fatty acid hydroxylase superfamily)